MNKILNDVQNQSDSRNIDIDQVGVTSVRMPIIVMDKVNTKQHTIGDISMSVSLLSNYKGTHMSRFLEVFNNHSNEINMYSMPKILSDLKQKLNALKAQISIKFPYFIKKKAPVSNIESYMDYNCCFWGESTVDGDDFTLETQIPVTSVCPCSKAISDYGAHNQRGIIDIKIRTIKQEDGKFALFWIEELIDIAESSGSAPVYSLLKRPDERHVTMQAYDNPVFVEDIVRNVAVKLRDDPRITWFCVNVENQESIHNHNAFAKIEWSR